MLNRLSGIVLIVNTLLPVLLVGGLIGMYCAVRGPVGQIITSVGEIRGQINIIKPEYDKAVVVINAKIEDSKERLARVGKTFGDVNRVVKAGFSRLNIDTRFPQMPRIVIPHLIDLQVPQIPNINVPIGDVLAAPFNGIRDALGFFVVIFTNMKDVANQVGTLLKHPNIAKIKVEIGKIETAGTELSEVGPWILTIVTVLVVVAVPWMVLSYALWAYRRLATGWALFRTGRAGGAAA